MLKSGHSVNIYWHRFVDDYVSTLWGLERGKGPRSAYISNFDGFTSYQVYKHYDNLIYISPSLYHVSAGNYYSGVDVYTSKVAFITNYEEIANNS